MPLTLEDFLSKVYDRTQRTTAQTQHRAVLRWQSIESTSPFEYPFKWAASAESWSSSEHALWSASGTAYHWAMPYPTYVACGAGTAANGSALGDEIERFIVPWKRDLGADEMIVRIAGEAKRQEAVGTWNELGVYYGNATIAMLDNCVELGSWVSENTLTLDTVTVRHGPGCLRSQGDDSIVSFRNIGGLDSPGVAFSGEDRFQMWYYVNDTAYLDSGEEVVIRVGSSPISIETDYYEFRVPHASLASGWNWLSWAVGDYDASDGLPDYSTIVSFRLQSWKLSSSIIERIDKIRLFKHAGTLWGYHALGTAIEKEWGETKWVYWDIQFE